MWRCNTDAFSHRCSYAEMFVHTDAFTYTDAFTHKHLLHTHTHSHTHTCLRIHFYTGSFANRHRDAFSYTRLWPAAVSRLCFIICVPFGETSEYVLKLKAVTNSIDLFGLHLSAKDSNLSKSMTMDSKMEHTFLLRFQRLLGLLAAGFSCCGQRERERMWKCEDVKMWRSEDVKMWRRCEDDVKMMWRWCEDEKMWKRCEDEKMWRWCEDDEKMWRIVKMYSEPPLFEEPFAQTLSGYIAKITNDQRTR